MIILFLLGFAAGLFIGYRAAIDGLFNNNKIKYTDVLAYSENMWSIIWNYIKIF